MAVQAGLAVNLRTSVMSRQPIVHSSHNYLAAKANGEGPGSQGESEVSNIVMSGIAVAS
jgi:hypothetical protein